MPKDSWRSRWPADAGGAWLSCGSVFAQCTDPVKKNAPPSSYLDGAKLNQNKSLKFMLHDIDSAAPSIQYIEPLTKNEVDATKQNTQQASILCTTKPSTGILPGYPDPNVADAGGVTGLILSLAVLIRSIGT